MVNARRLAIPTLALLGAFTLPGPAPISDASADWERLRSMPQELRNHLADQLKAFDTLDRAEQEAVRTLDRRLASEPEENRASYYAVLRRFHFWVQSLSEAQRNELNTTPPDGRMALVSKLLADQKGKHVPETSTYHYADFGGVSPFDQAQRIMAWKKLTPAQKAEVSKLPEPNSLKQMTQYVREMKIQITRPSPSENDAVYKRALATGRFPFLKKVEETKKKDEEAKKKANNIKHRFVDNYHFVEHPPAKVSPDKLLEFDRSLPVWIRNGFDTLPPEETRRRLTILYRLVYPSGEMGASNQAPPPPTPSRPGFVPSPPPDPKPATAVKPF